MSGEVESALDAAQARELTARIRGALESAHGLIVAAYAGRVWVALDYASWDDYCAAELAGSRMVRLEPGQRREIVAQMREAGMSTRAIASGIGVAQRTVVRDAGESDDSPAAPLDGAEPGPRTTTGTDGKTYPRPTPGTHASPKVAAMGAAWAQAVAEGRTQEAPGQRREPLRETADRASPEVRKLTARLNRLAGDDRLGRNRDTVRRVLLRELHEHRRALDALIAALDEGSDR